jgi:hypothetical protein
MKPQIRVFGDPENGVSVWNVLAQAPPGCDIALRIRQPIMRSVLHVGRGKHWVQTPRLSPFAALATHFHTVTQYAKWTLSGVQGSTSVDFTIESNVPVGAASSRAEELLLMFHRAPPHGQPGGSIGPVNWRVTFTKTDTDINTETDTATAQGVDMGPHRLIENFKEHEVVTALTHV